MGERMKAMQAAGDPAKRRIQIGIERMRARRGNKGEEGRVQQRGRWWGGWAGGRGRSRRPKTG